MHLVSLHKSLHKKRKAALFCALTFSLVFMSTNAMASKQTSSDAGAVLAAKDDVRRMADKAKNYQVSVTDNKGNAVKNAIVEFHLLQTETPSPKKLAVMDQVEEQFKPHVLAIEKGTLVSFPNSDNIKHHVYSFSAAKSFEQGLYKGRQAQPIEFESAGIVDLGCNIHDWMLGYIYVADSAYFAKTDSSGKINLSVPDSIKSISIWHPRMQEKELRLMLTPKANETTISFQLENEMRKDTEGYEDLSLDGY